MPTGKHAIIDLGTNTFHLIVASFDENGNLKIFHRDRQFIYLAEEGINKIGEKAIHRALRCLNDFRNAINRYQPDTIFCSGTAALRTASNGQILTNTIKEQTGIDVQIIDGMKEADFIFRGVSLAVPETRFGNHIIMDIGGGSVEFILVEDGKRVWKRSFPIGIAILRQKFHLHEPILLEEVEAMNRFLKEELDELLIRTKGIHYHSLIGASGSFEVLSGMLEHDITTHKKLDIPIPFFIENYEIVIKEDLHQRLSRTDIPNTRAPLIVVAFHLMYYILSHISFNKIIVSSYAMKEGMLQEISSNF